jgi:hypothetical protein
VARSRTARGRWRRGRWQGGGGRRPRPTSGGSRPPGGRPTRGSPGRAGRRHRTRRRPGRRRAVSRSSPAARGDSVGEMERSSGSSPGVVVGPGEAEGVVGQRQAISAEWHMGPTIMNGTFFVQFLRKNRHLLQERLRNGG